MVEPSDRHEEREGGWERPYRSADCHLSSLSMAVLDGLMRKGDGP
jgi:hypothetical protein